MQVINQKPNCKVSRYWAVQWKSLHVVGNLLLVFRGHWKWAPCKCEGEVETEDHSRRNTAHLSEDVPSAACNRAGKWRDTADSNSAFGLSPFGVIGHILVGARKSEKVFSLETTAGSPAISSGLQRYPPWHSGTGFPKVSKPEICWTCSDSFTVANLSTIARQVPNLTNYG